MKSFLNSLFILCLAFFISSCGEVASQSDEDALSKLWISTDGNDYDLNLSQLKFNQQFPSEFRDKLGNQLCVCTTTFLGTGDTGQYILNCPSSCAVQFSSLSTTRGSYTLSLEGVLELCRNPSNALLCREYK